jgi:Rieske Fe-S protein
MATSLKGAAREADRPGSTAQARAGTCPGLARRGFFEIVTGAAACGLLARALSAWEVASPPYDALASVSGLVAVDSGVKKLLFIRTTDADVVVLDRLCTHQACDLDPQQSGRWDAASQTMECSCHLAKFSNTGAVLGGPAPTPLRMYPVTFDPTTGKGSVDLS